LLFYFILGLKILDKYYDENKLKFKENCFKEITNIVLREGGGKIKFIF
jgi:hypothetical protein